MGVPYSCHNDMWFQSRALCCSTAKVQAFGVSDILCLGMNKSCHFNCNWFILCIQMYYDTSLLTIKANPRWAVTCLPSSEGEGFTPLCCIFNKVTFVYTWCAPVPCPVEWVSYRLAAVNFQTASNCSSHREWISSNTEQASTGLRGW